MKKLFVLLLFWVAIGVTSVAQVVGSSQIELRPLSDATKALEGNVSGVLFNSSPSNPDKSPSLRVRGFGSINMSSEPLYVVDGMPYDGPLSLINPSDIESIRVLKDASETAIYGVRGANGVVVIQTKRGGNSSGDKK